MAKSMISVLPVAPVAVQREEKESNAVPATITITGNQVTITATLDGTSWNGCKPNAKTGKPSLAKYATLAIQPVQIGGWRVMGTANVFLRPPVSE